MRDGQAGCKGSTILLLVLIHGLAPAGYVCQHPHHGFQLLEDTILAYGYIFVFSGYTQVLYSVYGTCFRPGAFFALFAGERDSVIPLPFLLLVLIVGMVRT